MAEDEPQPAQEPEPPTEPAAMTTEAIADVAPANAPATEGDDGAEAFEVHAAAPAVGQTEAPGNAESNGLGAPAAEGLQEADRAPAGAATDEAEEGGRPNEAGEAQQVQATVADAEGGAEKAQDDEGEEIFSHDDNNADDDVDFYMLSRPQLAEIEGFYDDFKDGDLGVEGDGLGAVEEGGGQGIAPEDKEEEDAEDIDLSELLAEAENDLHELKQYNNDLHKRILVHFSGRKSKMESKPSNGIVDGEGTRYQQALSQWTDTIEELDRVGHHYADIVDELTKRLEEKEQRATEFRTTFLGFKYEVALTAENSRTGKPLSEKMVRSLEQQELRKDEEVEHVRLKNIHLRNQMRKLELNLKQKEELADGLHLIDFEQLKIENESLNEKIEERSEELRKLRKKTTSTVQVLTHLKEKLQFVGRENEGLQRELDGLDMELAHQRDALQHAKQRRDHFRQQNATLKAQSARVTNHVLLADMERQTDRVEVLRGRVKELLQMHGAITGRIAR